MGYAGRNSETESALPVVGLEKALKWEDARPPSTVFVWFVVPMCRREAGKNFERDASAFSDFRVFWSEDEALTPLRA